MDASLEPDLERLAILAEPVRRRIYLYVAPRRDPVGRDEAAAAVGVSRALAAFHLDRLVEEGLLDAEYRRLSGRSGPGAGRPAKLYRRVSRDLAISLPQRNYRLAAELMADALDDADGTGAGDPREALRSGARAFGHALGEAARSLADNVDAGADAAGSEADRRVGALTHVLAHSGFEPHDAGDGEIRLGNCPFHAIASSHRSLTCRMNLALLQGVLEGVGAPHLEARLDPRPGMCCVALSASASAAAPASETIRDRDIVALRGASR